MLLSAVTAGAIGAIAGPAAAASPKPRANASCAAITMRDGVKLFHREWGAGRPALFVHSWGLTSDIWAYQIAALGSQGLRCIMFDRRGHGRSEMPATGYDMDTLADDLAAVIEGLNLRDVVLVGHSMGCAEIVRYVGRHGTSRVAKIALLAPTTPGILKSADNPHGPPAAYFDGVRAEWAADFPKWVEDNKRPFFTADTSPAMIDWLVSVMLRLSIPVGIACSKAFVETDLRPDLAKIDRPVLILQGDRDVSAPLELTGRRTAAGIRGAILKVYEGAPHGLFVTHMKRVNSDLLAFINA